MNEIFEKSVSVQKSQYRSKQQNLIIKMPLHPSQECICAITIHEHHYFTRFMCKRADLEEKMNMTKLQNIISLSA